MRVLACHVSVKDENVGVSDESVWCVMPVCQMRVLVCHASVSDEGVCVMSVCQMRVVACQMRVPACHASVSDESVGVSVEQVTGMVLYVHIFICPSGWKVDMAMMGVFQMCWPVMDRLHTIK